MSEQKPKSSNQTPDIKEMPLYQIEDLIGRLETELQEFVSQEEQGNTLTGKDRRRLISARVRNNGFIDKAFEIAHDNSAFMPPHFDIGSLEEMERRFEKLRQLTAVLQQFQQASTNAYVQQSDACYREALRIYGSLQEQTRGRVSGAEPLFKMLQNFFQRKRRTGDEPTEMEVERDFKKLLHGKAEGEVIVRNEMPVTTGGVRKVIDSVHTGRTAVKETAEASVAESTGKK